MPKWKVWGGLRFGPCLHLGIWVAALFYLCLTMSWTSRQSASLWQRGSIHPVRLIWTNIGSPSSLESSGIDDFHVDVVSFAYLGELGRDARQSQSQLLGDLLGIDLEICVGYTELRDCENIPEVHCWNSVWQQGGWVYQQF